MLKPGLRRLGYSPMPAIVCLLLDAIDFKVPAPLFVPVRLLILALGYWAYMNNF